MGIGYVDRFPSPYGETFFLTCLIMLVGLNLILFPSPYGESFFLTSDQKKELTVTLMVSVPLRGIILLNALCARC